MAKMRWRDEDYVLVVDALENYETWARNHVCSDYAETHGIAAMREWEKRALHCNNLIARIRRARSAP